MSGGVQSGDSHGGNPERTARALGLRKCEVLCDFSVNLNPLGFPPSVEDVLNGADSLASPYPDIFAGKCEAGLAKALGLGRGGVIAGNGATELFSLAAQASGMRDAIVFHPSYGGYKEVCDRLGMRCHSLFLRRRGRVFHADFGGLDKSLAAVVFICTPNNPTGQLTDPEKIIVAARWRPEKTFVVDESFMDFCGDSEGMSLLGRKSLPGNILVVRSLTKFFSIAGLRAGFAQGAPKMISAMKKLQLPWSVNALVQQVVPKLYQDREYVRKSVAETARLRRILARGLAATKILAPFPSEANFILCELTGGRKVADVQRALLEDGILTRSCEKMEGLGPGHMRFAVRPEDEIETLLDSLRRIGGRKIQGKPQRTPAVMVVGTTSNAGKSIIATALCGLFSARGLRVSPFKAQNMSLNSHVTPEGGEIGRAQALQAEACGIEPHTDMNPVLLKPLGDSRSQVIVNGRPLENLDARSYYERKAETRAEAFKAYDRLAKKHDLIVMEGAGSPAEINLLDEDFVNMRMAEHAGAPALLVADIDRGGVFASIFGTIKLLPAGWRRLIKGVIINKFRGDPSLLDSGIRKIEAMTGIPVLGVMPYIRDINLEDEDSLGLETKRGNSSGALRVRVVRLPRISNFTDFLPMERLEAVDLRYVERSSELDGADMIIIPGSKNTIGDMRFVRENGFEAGIKAAAANGVPVIGICGGYQMLGRKISDPHGVEGSQKSIKGMGLLPVETILERGKQLSRTSGVTGDSFPFARAGTKFAGYEIHAGRTSPVRDDAPLFVGKNRVGSGSGSENGLVFGCYIHGLFDSAELTSQMVSRLLKKKGIDAVGQDADGKKEALERLVRTFAKHVDVKRIEKIIRGRQ